MAKTTIQHESDLGTPMGWAEALASYREVETEYDRRTAVEEISLEAAHAMVPRIDEYFDFYRLHIGMDRGGAHRSVHSALWMKEFGHAGLVLWPKEKREPQEAKAQLVKTKADRVTDEFMAYQGRWQAIRVTLGVEEAQNHAAEMREEYFSARSKLLAVPALDTAGLLLKLELAFVSGAQVDEEFALSDARRLLAA